MHRRPCLLALLVVLGCFAAPARAAVLPDLVVTSIGAPTSVVAGSALTVRTTVKNLQGRAGSSYVRVVLSKDKLVGSTDKVLGKRFVPALAAGATSTGSKTWTIPATTAGGAWFLVACADATKLVREAREGNNCRARALTVTREPIELLVEQPTPAVTEGGSTSVQVRLSRAPDATVTVTPSSPDGRISPAVSSLTFTPASWSTPQELVVHAEHDDDLADGVGALSLTSPAVVAAQLAWNIDDDDTQAIQTTPSAASLAEGGTTTVGVRLAYQPAGDITVSVASGDTGAVTVAPSSLVFTPSSWATPQNVVLTGVHDVDLTAESVTISLTSTGVTSASVTATVTDDDSLAVRSSGSSRAFREGTQSSVDITLSHQPPGNTTVTCSASPGGSVGVSPASMTFTPANYAIPQTLVLTGFVDGDQEDDSVVVTCSATGATSVTIAVTVVENV